MPHVYMHRTRLHQYTNNHQSPSLTIIGPGLNPPGHFLGQIDQVGTQTKPVASKSAMISLFRSEIGLLLQNCRHHSINMSGIEGIGISLGVLSLVVSSIEHYEDVFRPFQRYKAFAPEIARFERRLLAQKTIFRSQCQLLLIPLIDVETTTKMIDEKGKHQMWRSAELEQSLKDNLGQSAEACVATMIDMEEQLKTVQGKAQGYLPVGTTIAIT